jgi:MarR family 2-MHQ and catechol resistance regulon transcriptional repressor
MGTRHKGKKSEILALDTLIKLLRASDSVEKTLRPEFSNYGLTESQFGVIEALFHIGPLSQTALGTKILKSGGNITMVIDNLEKRALVKRLKNLSDRRKVRVELTKKGLELINEIFPTHVKKIVSAMSCLTSSEQKSLQELCKKLGHGQTN